MNRFNWIFFILLVLVVLNACEGPAPVSPENRLKQTAHNFCSCHQGLRGEISLEHHSALRAICNDGSARLFFISQTFEPCHDTVKGIGHENKRSTNSL